MLIDTHSHLNFSAFDSDRNKVIKKCLDQNVWIINVGTNYDTSKKAIEITEKHSKGVYAAIGLHPINLETNLIKQKFDESEGGRFEKEFDYEKYKKLGLSSKKVVAIGEIGLDYYYKPKSKRKLELFKQKQKDLLLQEIKLAQNLNLPIIFHCRLALNDLIATLEVATLEVQPPEGGQTSEGVIPEGVIHCFTGNWEQAKKFLDMGFYLGFNGIIFKLDLIEVIKKTPLDKILLETDCPFLTPPLPRRSPTESGTKAGRNEPIFIKYIAEHIAKIKNIPIERITEVTTKNAKELFKI